MRWKHFSSNRSIGVLQIFIEGTMNGTFWRSKMQETAQYFEKRFFQNHWTLMLGRWSPRTRGSTWSSSPWASSTRRSTSFSCSTCTVARSTLTRHASLPPLLSYPDQDLLWQNWIKNRHIPYVSLNQCCGSVTFWYRSGSADPCLWPMDPDPAMDPAIFVLDLQDANIKLFFSSLFLLITFWRYIYVIFLR
jgi:hypothetical protein